MDVPGLLVAHIDSDAVKSVPTRTVSEVQTATGFKIVTHLTLKRPLYFAEEEGQWWAFVSSDAGGKLPELLDAIVDFSKSLRL